MEEIKFLCAEFLSQPFPTGYVEKGDLAELDIDLAELDTYAAGCISTYVYQQGNIDKDRVAVLKECVKKLKTLSKLFDDNNLEQKAYAIQLLVSCEKVILTSE